MGTTKWAGVFNLNSKEATWVVCYQQCWYANGDWLRSHEKQINYSISKKCSRQTKETPSFDSITMPARLQNSLSASLLWFVCYKEKRNVYEYHAKSTRVRLKRRKMSGKTHIYRVILLFDNYCLSFPVASLIAVHSSRLPTPAVDSDKWQWLDKLRNLSKTKLVC